MGRSSASGDDMANTSRILTTPLGSHPHGYRSNSSTSTRSVPEVNYILKETYLPAIREQLLAPSTLLTHFVVSPDPNDWGFDNIYPAPQKSWEQVWFRDWVRRVREDKFTMMMEDEVEGLTNTMRRDINRQIYSDPKY